ncbi:MAG: hypothetical protein H6Q52_1881 [Deltaproteobacteria bacterium]|nr:hypothetical protein [Deltaproteobacteria bacterium]
MELIYFTGKKTSAKDPLLLAIKLLAPARGLTEFCLIEEFTRKVAEDSDHPMFVVMRPHDEEALIDIYFTRHLLSRIPGILILPNRERHTAALAFRIGPTRIFPCDANHSEVVAAVSAFLNKWPENTIPGSDKYSAAA